VEFCSPCCSTPTESAAWLEQSATPHLFERSASTGAALSSRVLSGSSICLAVISVGAVLLLYGTLLRRESRIFISGSVHTVSLSFEIYQKMVNKNYPSSAARTSKW